MSEPIEFDEHWMAPTPAPEAAETFESLIEEAVLACGGRLDAVVIRFFVDRLETEAELTACTRAAEVLRQFMDLLPPKHAAAWRVAIRGESSRSVAEGSGQTHVGVYKAAGRIRASLGMDGSKS